MTHVRQVWMDAVRGACILLVMLWHGALVMEWLKPSVPAGLSAFNNAFAPFRMPVLTFLSGMLLERALKKPTGMFIRGKIFSLYWPYLLWSLLFLAVRGTLWPERALTILWKPETYLWFLHNLFLFYLAFLALCRLRIPLLPVAVASLLLAEFGTDQLAVARALFLFAFFLLGHLAQSRNWIGRVPMPILVAAGAAAIAGAGAGLTGHEMRYQLMFAWAPLALIVVVLALAPRYRPLPLLTLLQWIGANSIVFYASHMTFQMLAGRLMQRAGVTGIWMYLLLPLAISFLGAAAMQAARARWHLAGLPFDLGVLRQWRASASRPGARGEPPRRTGG